MSKKKPKSPKRARVKKPQPAPSGKAQVVKFIPPWESGTAGPAMGVCEEDTGDAYDWSHISPKAAVMRRMFVLEYIKDFNGTAAILRMGLKYRAPKEAASRWLSEPYTQFILDQVLSEIKSETFVTRDRIIMALLKEANAPDSLCANSASRVAALGKLAKILGLEVTKIEANVKVAHGVMFVPLASSADDWEKHAVPSQAALKVHAIA